MELTKEQLIKRQTELYTELYTIKGKLATLEKETYSVKGTCLMSAFDDITSFAKVINCDNSKVSILLVDVKEKAISIVNIYYYELSNDWVTCTKEAFDEAYNKIINKINKAYNE